MVGGNGPRSVVRPKIEEQCQLASKTKRTSGWDFQNKKSSDENYIRLVEVSNAVPLPMLLEPVHMKK